MRTLFKKAGFQTYLVDEFRTSRRCSKCEGGICVKNVNPRPYRTGNVPVHGLICCKNGCGYWNRDVNGATNIYKIQKFYNQQNYKIVSWNHKNESSKNSDGTYVFEHSKPQLWDTIYDYVDGKYSKISKKGKNNGERKTMAHKCSNLSSEL